MSIETIVHESSAPTIVNVAGGTAEPEEPSILDLQKVEPASEEAPAPEPTKELTKEEVAVAAAKESDDPKWRARFAQLTKERRELDAQKKQLKEEAKEIEQLKALKASAKDNPMALLQAAGVDYDGVVKFLMQDGKPKPPSTDDKVAELQAKLEAVQKANEERDAQLAAERAQLRHEQERVYVQRELAKEPERWELLNASDNADRVLQVIRHVKQEGGWVDVKGQRKVYDPGHDLSMDEAADIIEDILESQEAERLKRTSTLKKLQKYLPKVDSKPEAKAETPPVRREVKPAPKTITNGKATADAQTAPEGRVTDPDALLELAVSKLRYT